MHRLPLLAPYAVLAILASGCASPQPPFHPTHDPNVTIFWSNRQSVWSQFRLGGGLNVVVANRTLPAAPEWRFNGAHAGTSATPVVSGATVLIASNDQRLYALDAATGATRWVWRTDNELMSSPVYADGLTIVGAGDALNTVLAPPVYTIMGSGHSHLDAIDLRTGNRLWRFELNGTGMPSPALSHGILIDFDGSGVVKALDARTGRFRWRRLLYSIGTMSNVLLGDSGTFYISGLWPNAIYALRTRDGSTVWRHRYSDSYNAISDAPLARFNGRLVSMYLAAPGANRHAAAVWMRPAEQHLYALDDRTGRTLWDTTLPHVRGIIPAWNESAIPLVVGASVYDGSAIAPIVTSLDLKTGRTRWQRRAGGPVKGGLVDRDGVLYFGDLLGMLWALDDRDGRVIGSVKTDLAFNVGSPIILNDSLVIGSQQGPVIAVPLAAIRESRAIKGVTSIPSTYDFETIGGDLSLVALLILLYAVRASARHEFR